ncbi:VWA domain-containing protein [Litoribrevibacter euphylliae]|uniref:VWA domain-containing protein n=1 Tax=Litoribrevibacter euphylliae TaxID=1834034 RepID=A0ABV7HHL2_9GAMM
MDTLFDSFHFARPLWFLAIIPAALALYYFINQVRSAQLWSKHISPELLSQLTDKQTGTGKSLMFAGLMSALLLLLIVALAGPSMKSENVQTLQTDDTLVIIMDLSLSMMAEDVAPSRLQRMKFKLQDLLEKRQTGYTALVVYSGDAHVVVPLTKDSDTIQHLAKSLSPWMVPSKGSRLHRAMEEANNLLQAYPGSNSRILLFTDEISEQQLDKTLSIAKYPTYVIGVGTPSGAPIPLPDGKLLKDNKQNIVVTKFIEEQPKTLAKETGGSFNMLSVDDSDISDALSFKPDRKESQEDLQKLAAVKDYGYLLLIPAFFMMLLSFRKGWLLALGLIILQPVDTYAAQANTSTTEPSVSSPKYESSVWDQLWLNESQQAQKAYDMKNYATAAKLFDDPIKKADAYAKNKQWQDAESAYQGLPSATAKYNLANVQAKQQKWEDAEKSYDQAIEAAKAENRQDILERAQKDKSIIEQMKQQQQAQNNQQQNGQDGQDNQNKDQQSGENQNGQEGDQSQNNQGSNQDQSDASEQNSNNSENQQSSQENSQPNSQQGSQNDSEQNQSSEQQSQSSQQNQGASDQESQSGQSDANLNEQQAQSAAEKAEQNQDAMSQSQSDAQASEDEDVSGQATQAMQDDDQQGVEDFGKTQAISPTMEPSPEDVEEQKYQQILRKVQTDPSILLENKFRIQHYQRNKPENEAQVW